MAEKPYVARPSGSRVSPGMRKRQGRAAIKEALAEWQADLNYCAVRVTTFARQCCSTSDPPVHASQMWVVDTNRHSWPGYNTVATVQPLLGR